MSQNRRNATKADPCFSCDCGKKFPDKNALYRHLVSHLDSARKRQSDVTNKPKASGSGAVEGNKLKFLCTICKKSFPAPSVLERHQKTKHGNNDKFLQTGLSNLEYKLAESHEENSRNLSNDSKTIPFSSPDLSKRSLDDAIPSCSEESFTISSPGCSSQNPTPVSTSLTRRMPGTKGVKPPNKGNVDYESLREFLNSKNIKTRRTRTNNIQCPSLNCLYQCNYRKQLRKHITEQHAPLAPPEELLFTDEDDFKAWKCNFEKSCKSRFVKRTSCNLLKGGVVCENYFCCRSRRSSKSPKKRKTHKIDGHCPAQIKVLKKGVIKVTVWKQHFGHGVMGDQFALTPKDKQAIAQSLIDGASFNSILNEVHCLGQLQFLTKADLYCLARSYNVYEKRRQLGRTCLEAMIKEFGKRPALCPFAYMKPHGEKPTNVSNFLQKDFLLVLQSPIQKAILNHVSYNTVCIEKNFDVTTSDFCLFSLFVAVGKIKTFSSSKSTSSSVTVLPVAWALCSRDDPSILGKFFETLRDECGLASHFSERVQHVVTAPCNSHHTTWQAVFGASSTGQLCRHHALKHWQQNARKLIAQNSLRLSVLRELLVLIDTKDTAKFTRNFDEFYSKLSNKEQCADFFTYFHRNFAHNVNKWGSCYKEAGLVAVDRAVHGFVATHYLDPSFSRRIDRCIQQLVRLAQEMCTEGFSPAELRCFQPHLNETARNVDQDHLCSLSITSVENTTAPEGDTDNQRATFMIAAQDSPLKYCLTLHQKACTTSCSWKCMQCLACCHILSCECIQYVISSMGCPHIHAVAIHLNMKGRNSSLGLLSIQSNPSREQLIFGTGQTTASGETTSLDQTDLEQNPLVSNKLYLVSENTPTDVHPPNSSLQLPSSFVPEEQSLPNTFEEAASGEFHDNFPGLSSVHHGASCLHGGRSFDDLSLLSLPDHLPPSVLIEPHWQRSQSLPPVQNLNPTQGASFSPTFSSPQHHASSSSSSLPLTGSEESQLLAAVKLSLQKQLHALSQFAETNNNLAALLELHQATEKLTETVGLRSEPPPGSGDEEAASTFL